MTGLTGWINDRQTDGQIDRLLRKNTDWQKDIYIDYSDIYMTIMPKRYILANGRNSCS